MIRPATPADSETLLQITQETGFFKPHEVETLREVLSDYHAAMATHVHGHVHAQEPRDRCFVLEDAGVIQGFVYHAPEPMTEGTWALWWIVVGANTQGKGLGSTLLKFVEGDAKKAGARVLFIDTSGLPFYEPTRRFYVKHHYDVEARLRDFYAAGDDKIVFRKVL
jgi:ribosomal protein S18 acetylase RimI-like enzyme